MVDDITYFTFDDPDADGVRKSVYTTQRKLKTGRDLRHYYVTVVVPRANYGDKSPQEIFIDALSSEFPWPKQYHRAWGRYNEKGFDPANYPGGELVRIDHLGNIVKGTGDAPGR